MPELITGIQGHPQGKDTGAELIAPRARILGCVLSFGKSLQDAKNRVYGDLQLTRKLGGAIGFRILGHKLQDVEGSVYGRRGILAWFFFGFARSQIIPLDRLLYGVWE
jgi:hypothetical protein